LLHCKGEKGDEKLSSNKQQVQDMEDLIVKIVDKWVGHKCASHVAMLLLLMLLPHEQFSNIIETEIQHTVGNAEFLQRLKKATKTQQQEDEEAASSNSAGSKLLPRALVKSVLQLAQGINVVKLSNIDEFLA